MMSFRLRSTLIEETNDQKHSHYDHPDLFIFILETYDFIILGIILEDGDIIWKRSDSYA